MTTPRKPTPEEMAVDLEGILKCHAAGGHECQGDCCVGARRARYAERRLERIAEMTRVIPGSDSFEEDPLAEVIEVARAVHAIAMGTES